MAVKKGDKVSVNYVGKHDDVSVFDRSGEGKPLVFTVGEGKVIPGFDKGVEGMELNEEKTINVEPGQGYGERDESLLRKVTKSSLPENFKAEKGMVVRLHLPNGAALPATIKDVGENDIVVDLNHPLAGKTLVFDVKLVGIE